MTHRVCFSWILLTNSMAIPYNCINTSGLLSTTGFKGWRYYEARWMETISHHPALFLLLHACSWHYPALTRTRGNPWGISSDSTPMRVGSLFRLPDSQTDCVLLTSDSRKSMINRPPTSFFCIARNWRWSLTHMAKPCGWVWFYILRGMLFRLMLDAST